MSIKISKKIDILNLLFAVTAFLGLRPYFIWNRLSFIYPGFVIVSSLLFWVNSAQKQHKLRLNDLSVVLYMLFLITFIFHRNFELLLKTVVLNVSTFSFLLMKNEKKRIVFKYIMIVFALSLVPGLIVYILNLIGLDLNWEYLRPDGLKTELGYHYRKYFGAVVLESSRNMITGLYRFCGMYDEPGVVGTVSALLLAGIKFDMKSIWSKIILIGGVLSFSLAFYVLVVLYFTLEFFISKRYKPAIFLLCLLSVLVILPSGIGSSTFFRDTVLDRLTIVGRTFAGNNRTTGAYDLEFNNFLNSGVKNLLIGVGSEERLSKPEMITSSSYKNRIYDSGLIGFGMLVFLFIFLMPNSNNKNTLVFLIVFLASIYQRADILNFSYITLFVSSVSNLEFYSTDDGYKKYKIRS